MSNNTTGAAKVTFTEQDDSQTLSGAAFDIGAMFGVAQRGIPNKPTLLSSFRDFIKSFGAYLASSDLAFAAKRALDGGCPLWVSRIASSDAVASSLTLSTDGGGQSAATMFATVVGTLWQGVRTFSMADGDVLQFNLDGAPYGGSVSATPATMVTTGGPTFALNHGETIEYKVNGGPTRTITLSTAVTDGAVTAQQLTNEISAQGVGIQCSLVSAGAQVQITTDQRGSGASLNIVGGTAVIAGFAGTTNGSGNVADADHVTPTEIQSILDGAKTGLAVTVDTSGYLVVTRTQTGASAGFQFIDSTQQQTDSLTALGFDTTLHTGATGASVPTLKLQAGQYGSADPGGWGNNLQCSVALATRNPSTRFALIVKYQGTIVDTLDEVSMDPSDDRYVLKLLASHPYLVATDLKAAVSDFTAARPAVLAGAPFIGGSDGVTTLDFIGDSVAKTGLYAFDARKEPSYIGAPGYVDRTFALALCSYCENRGDLFAVLDGPDGLTTSQKTDYRMATGTYTGGAAFDCSYGAVYWNLLEITDPTTKLARSISNMGAVFARYANANINGQASPAGATAGGLGGRISIGSPPVQGLAEEIPIDGDGDTIATYGMNFLLNHPTYGYVIWGERNLQAVQSDLDRVPQRRWNIYARKTLQPLLDEIALFQPNDEQVWARTRDIVNPWLRKEIAKGAINDAIFNNDATLNDAAAIAAHIQKPQLLVKHSPHSEFVNVLVVDVAQDATIVK